MAKADKNKKTTKFKKGLRAHVSRSLEEMFKDFESAVGKRKFRRNIKKASKVLTTNVKPAKLKSSDATPLFGEDVVHTGVSRVIESN